MADDMEARFRAVTHKLWGPEEGEGIYQWIVATRPPAFHEKLINVMVPIWEMDKVELKTKIMCAISLFVGLHRDRSGILLQDGGLPQYSSGGSGRDSYADRA